MRTVRLNDRVRIPLLRAPQNHFGLNLYSNHDQLSIIPLFLHFVLHYLTKENSDNRIIGHDKRDLLYNVDFETVKARLQFLSRASCILKRV